MSEIFCDESKGGLKHQIHLQGRCFLRPHRLLLELRTHRVPTLRLLTTHHLNGRLQHPLRSVLLENRLLNLRLAPRRWIHPHLLHLDHQKRTRRGHRLRHL